jgi:hypothetical protein
VSRRGTPAGAELGDRVSRGTVAGVAAGLLFLVANMLWATKSDLPAVAPLIDISTIFNFDDVASPTPRTCSSASSPT